MPQEAVAQHEIEPRQFQQRRPALLVVPADARIADDDLALRQDPSRDSRVSRLVGAQLHAPYMEPAAFVAPDLQARPLEGERVEPRRSDHGGDPGEGRLDAGQAERRPAVVIEDGHVGEQELGAQALPARFHRADRDASAQDFRRVLLDVAPVLRDLREDPVAKGEKGRGEQEVGDEQHPADDARGDAPPAFRRNRLGYRFLDRLLELL